MAAIAPFEMFCNIFETEVNILMATAKTAISMIKARIKDLQDVIDVLKDKIPSGQDLLDLKLSELDDALADDAPDFSDIDKIQEILVSCNILQEMLQFPNFAGILDSYLRDLESNISGTLESALALLEALVEYPVAYLVNMINGFIESYDLSVDVQRLRDLLQCINAVCGRDVSSELLELNNLLDGAYLTSAAGLNTSRLYSEGGLTPQHILNVTTCVSRIESSTNNAISSVQSEVSGFLNNVKGLMG